MGWELFRDRPLVEEMRARVDAMRAYLQLPVKPIEVGRYDVMLDAYSVANIVYPTIGLATELDTAMGYEANADGTSYITAPLEMLSTFKMGAPALTITANRSEPGGATTVKWDDEGVEPDICTLVKDGVLHDFQTTRESAGWLKDAYLKAGRSVIRSHGFAEVSDAVHAPLSR